MLTVRHMAVTLGLLLSGCGIPDYYPPPPKPEPCEVVVVTQPNNTARCVSREHARRDMCKLTECL